MGVAEMAEDVVAGLMEMDIIEQMVNVPGMDVVEEMENVLDKEDLGVEMAAVVRIEVAENKKVKAEIMEVKIEVDKEVDLVKGVDE
jgi:predicted homoserine dehydrogenase-like protein